MGGVIRRRKIAASPLHEERTKIGYLEVAKNTEQAASALDCVSACYMICFV